MTQHDHRLSGCTPTPLASYLKALAVLRLVAEQAGDPNAMGYWDHDVFVLRTQMHQNELMDFFLNQYVPTPLVAPWNGGSGFYPKDNKEGINLIANTQQQRFAVYQEVIATCRKLVAAYYPEESPKGEDKTLLLHRLRNQAPENLLAWFDAAVILSDETPRFPPLLGTGGNDGRLDFTNNFMQRLVEVFDVSGGEPKPESERWLANALFGEATPGLPDRAIGQFAPGNAGGPNATTSFEGSSRTNPWDFILMLEGALLFAASAARRLESSTGAVMSAPFTVRSRLATVGRAALTDDASARGEMWMPLWHAPCTLQEIQSLFAEGRAALGTRPARDGLDFARAVARLGVDRGITEFQRYGFLMRSGKAFLATPLARVAVRRNHHADLINEVDVWLERVQRHARGDTAPQSFRSLAAQLDAALFHFTQRAERQVVERVLRLLGRLEAACAPSPSCREAIPPVPKLSWHWANQINDSSAEFRIAQALAGLSMAAQNDGKAPALGLRPHLTPVSWSERDWLHASHLAVWGPGTVERNLAALVHRRRLEAIRLGTEGEIFHSHTGARLKDVHWFFTRQTEDRRIAELMHGLACVRLGEQKEETDVTRVPLPAAYFLLKPFFTAESLLRTLGWLPPDHSLRLPPEIPARLTARDINGALRIAWQRLRALGCPLPDNNPPHTPHIDGPRLLAALSIPLARSATRQVLKWLDFRPETASSNTLSPKPTQEEPHAP